MIKYFLKGLRDVWNGWECDISNGVELTPVRMKICFTDVINRNTFIEERLNIYKMYSC